MRASSPALRRIADEAALRQEAPVARDVHELAAVVVGGEHDVRALLRGGDHPLERVEVARGVGLHRDDQAVRRRRGQCVPEAAVERAARPLVPDLGEHLDGHLAAVGAGDLDGAVRRAVVDEQHAAAAPQLRPALEVGQQARDVGLLVVGRDDEDRHQYAPRRASTTGSVWTRILMSHQSDQLVT